MSSILITHNQNKGILEIALQTSQMEVLEYACVKLWLMSFLKMLRVPNCGCRLESFLQGTRKGAASFS